MSKLELTIIEVENGYRVIEGAYYGQGRHSDFPKEHVAQNTEKLSEIVRKLAEEKHPLFLSPEKEKQNE